MNHLQIPPSRQQLYGQECSVGCRRPWQRWSLPTCTHIPAAAPFSSIVHNNIFSRHIPGKHVQIDLTQCQWNFWSTSMMLGGWLKVSKWIWAGIQGHIWVPNTHFVEGSQCLKLMAPASPKVPVTVPLSLWNSQWHCWVGELLSQETLGPFALFLSE